MSRKILALDIQNNGVSAILARNTFKGSWIEAFRHIPFDGREQASAESENGLGRAIETLVSELDISGAECMVSLPPDKVSYRNLSVPFKDRRKIRKILPFEIESVLPFPVEELAIDFENTGRSDPTGIYVAAVRKSDMEVVTETLKTCGIVSQSIAPGALPAAVTFAAFSPDKTDFIWIDAESDDITMIAVSSGRVHLVRTIRSGAGDPVEKARRFQPYLIQFMAAFEACFHADFEPSAVLLSGMGLDFEILEAVIERVLGVPVKPVDLMALSGLNMVLSTPGGYEPDLYNGALGLVATEIHGLRLINFCGERSVMKRYWEEYKNDILTTGFITAFVVILGMFHVLLEAYYLQRSIDRINRQIVSAFQSTFPEITRIVDPVQQMRLALQEVREKNTFTGDMDAGISNIELFKEMSRSVPAGLDVEIIRLVRGDDDIIITGNTDTFQTVDEIKGSLEKSTLWKAITIASANLDKTSNRVEFRLKIDL